MRQLPEHIGEYDMTNIIRVASNSKTSGVAGAIAHSIRENGSTEIQGIGPGAVNQMIKATIMAKRFLSEEGTFIVFTPTFTEVDIDGQVRTAMRLTIISSLMPNGLDMSQLAAAPMGISSL
jgi:stage V sporulation protein S